MPSHGVVMERPASRQTALEAAFLPDTPDWALLVDDIRSALVPRDTGRMIMGWGHLGRASSQKATGILVVSESAEAGVAALAEMKGLMSDSPCAGCLLAITGEQLARGGSDARGGLQAALVHTLRSCPTTAIAVAAASELAASPAALPAVINALSEGGHLTADGQPVPTENLVLVVTMVAPSAVMATANDEDAFKSAAKAHFVNLFALPTGTVLNSSDLAKHEGYAEVLRRRLDFVAPLRLFSV